MTTLTATEKALLTRFIKVLDFTANTKKIDLETGEEKTHMMPIRQLTAVLETATKEGQHMTDFKYAGEAKSSISKNLRALSAKAARERQTGFNFVELKEDPIAQGQGAMPKGVYLTDRGEEFVQQVVQLLKEFSNGNKK